ncbi:MAG: tRNA epoxyqueuosine(34) reductase QueG [Rhodobacteraceae bacterium]|nr:tRNA epoxyqueuosine(34) reductase QueG [Paracoccaceae bacterium]
MSAALKAELLVRARALGFDLCRITRPDAVPHMAEALARFLAKGYHGQMAWLERRAAWRADPALLWPQAQSVIVLGESYTPQHDPCAVHRRADRGAISVYAQNRDYHQVMKARLKRLGRWLIARAGTDTRIKVFVDTAPVPEKPLGQAAGLGWQGKHTNLVSRDLGSWFFIGSIFTTLALPSDRAEPNRCGSCRACLDACPTRAFPAPGQIDARRCISYLTIEHKGPVDEALRPLMGNRIYGCDDCLAVCPWNKFAVKAREIRYQARDDLVMPLLQELLCLDEAAFRAKFAGTAIKRIGRNRFVRNVLYAMGNGRLAHFLPLIAPYTQDSDATLRDAAHWALRQFSRAKGQTAGPASPDSG